MQVRPDHLWLADVTVRPDGATPLTALCVARARRRMPAMIALQQAVAAKGLSAEIRLKATLFDLPLQEAADLGRGLDENRARLGGFGYDEPRALEGHPTLSAPPAPVEMPADSAALRQMLFAGGQQGPASDHAYALLDGARVFGLAEMLDGSGLDHRCLFNGRAAIDYAVTAPRLVRLLAGHRLSNMLTDVSRNEGPLSWGQGPGLLIRSPLSIDGLRRQLRAYTLIHDRERDRRVYFRFYDPRSFRTLIAHAAPESRAKFARGISLIACPTATGAMMIFARS